MSTAAPHRIAAAIVRAAAAVLPPALQPWGRAMRHEVAAIERPAGALLFAFGCLGFALRQAAWFHLLTKWETMSMMAYLLRHPRRVAALCAVGATSLGLAYLSVAGAPGRYLTMNVAALAVGFAIVGLVCAAVRSGKVGAAETSLALGAALLLASLFGTHVNGATRWIAAGPVLVQPSLLLLPVLALSFARNRDTLSLAGILLAALALALQPDRAMSGALAAGLAALALVRRERTVIIALLFAAAGFLATLLQADVQPAMPYVDRILYSAFDVHPLAGLAVVSGAALMIVPAIVGGLHDPGSRPAYAVFGAVWLAIILAAALGNYPTPLVGYGGSAIIGYVVSLLGLPRQARAGAVGTHGDRPEVAAPKPRQDLHLDLSYGR